MAVITAKGETDLGDIWVRITGEMYVDEIEASNEVVVRYIQRQIAAGAGAVANAYYPPPNTMDQAYAFCANVFGWDKVNVEGEIPTEEQDIPKGAIL